jgi:hypothetical protein
MSIIQPHSWCHIGDDNLTRVTLRSVNTELHAAMFFRHRYGPSTLVDHPGFFFCRAPLLHTWGSQPLPPSHPPWLPVLCSMAVAMAPLPLRILVPSSCHHHLRRTMPHAQRFFPSLDRHRRPLPLGRYRHHHLLPWPCRHGPPHAKLGSSMGARRHPKASPPLSRCRRGLLWPEQ